MNGIICCNVSKCVGVAGWRYRLAVYGYFGNLITFVGCEGESFRVSVAYFNSAGWRNRSIGCCGDDGVKGFYCNRNLGSSGTLSRSWGKCVGCGGRVVDGWRPCAGNTVV